MAQAKLVAEVSTKGAKKAERELKLVGTQAKRTETNVKNMGGSIQSIGKQAGLAASAINGPLGGIASRITAVTSLLSSGAIVATSFGVAITGMGFALSAGIKELDSINVELAKTEAILKATGQASGKTSQQLLEQARSIGLATLASTQGIQQAQAKLLTFDKIHGQVFDDAINLTQDLATVFGGDAASQATQLGKALQDPVKGLTALNRVGVSFTDQQSDQVKALVASGNAMKAQAIIVAALKAQVGGAGAAVAENSLAGKTDTAGQLWSEFAGKLADSSGAMSATERILDGMVNSLDRWNKALTPDTASDYVQQALDLGFAIGEQEQALEGLTKGSREYEITLIKIARLEGQRAVALNNGIAASKLANDEILKSGAAQEASILKIKEDSIALQATVEQDARTKQVLADLDFFDAREAYTIEQNKKINAANEQAYKDDAETYSTFLKLKADEDRRVDREKRRAQSEQIGALGDVTSNLKSTLGEQSALYKAAAITETTINTYKSATAAYSALAGIPYVGPALGAAAAGVAIAAGVANVRAITSAREQGGDLSAGQATTIAERDQVEVFIPNNAGKVKTANQLSAIGGGGGNNVSLTVIDQSGGAKEYQQEQRSDGEIILLIRNTVSADNATPNSQIDKSLTARGQTRRRA